MQYKIELRYSYGWDDASWTDETSWETKPTRFGTVDDSQAALDEFFDDVKAAVAAGNMDSEVDRADYRIVELKG